MKLYNNEREGQIDFFSTFRIEYKNNQVLIDNTDGIWNGNLFEFKLNISNINKTLFQAIKYLSKMRIKGKSIPANILLISLNDEICYIFKSKDYFDEIHKIYFGAASKDNDNFIAKSYARKLNYSNMADQVKLLEILKTKEYMPINIDENCIVGWAERYYRENPKANKGDFLGDTEGKVKIIGEIRNPNNFKGLILPYTNKTNEKFKYLMDKLNDSLRKKDLGAFYTPMIYCEKAAELVRKAIKNIPQNNDYIIIDRCAGTGNLESVLTDEELSHCILSTYEYYEYKVLCERLGDKVKFIIPPVETDDTYYKGFVKNADALQESYIKNELIQKYIKDENCSIILFENPPYAEANGTTKISSGFKASYVVSEMKKDVKGAVSNDLSNAFIWSAFKYYLRQPTDAYIVFSPVKYWKVQNLVNKVFEDGYAFNRRHFHTKIDACIMVALWKNENSNNSNKITLQAFDIVNDKLKYDGILEVNKIYSTFSKKYYDKRSFKDDKNGLVTTSTGKEFSGGRELRIKPIYNENIIGYLAIKGAGFDNPDLNTTLTVTGFYNGCGFYLRSDNYLEKLPMFAAGRYVTYNRRWTERGRIMKSGDGSDNYLKSIKSKKLNKELLKILLFSTLETQNHIRSFIGSDGIFYRNELCLDTTNGETIASRDLKSLSLNTKELELVDLWNKILGEARKTLNYDKSLTYGIYQIQDELNTSYKNDLGKTVYDYPELNGNIYTLKTLLKQYYLEEIVPVLFKYEFLK